MSVTTRGFSSAGPVTSEQETGQGTAKGGIKEEDEDEKEAEEGGEVKDHKSKAEVETIRRKE